MIEKYNELFLKKGLTNPSYFETIGLLIERGNKLCI